MKKEKLSILLVEDDALTAQLNKRLLSDYGSVKIARCIEESHDLLRKHQFDIAFFDLNLYGELDGLKLLQLTKVMNVYSIVLSGETRQEILVESFKNGAKDFLSKPFSHEKLNSVLSRYNAFLKSTDIENLIELNYKTKSQKLKKELQKIKNLEFSEKPIFIEGETGTGKRVIAHLIKEVLGKQTFLEINCSQYSDELFASEIFGHVKGAFTGAEANKKGLLELANNGIIFLDEIHCLSIKSQRTLLKAIEEKEFYPVGSDKKIKSNFRVVSATCENIEFMISQGQFRQDLFARIGTFKISLLPLRERKEDIVELLEHFISLQPFRIVITKEAMDVLMNYSWPNNTREIQDLVENWIINGNRLINVDDLPVRIKNNLLESKSIIQDQMLDLIEEIGLKEFMSVFKKEIVNEMTKRHNGVMKHAAKVMGVSYTTLFDFMKKNKNKSIYLRGL